MSVPIPFIDVYYGFMNNLFCDASFLLRALKHFV
jgi:hypothetical protein